MSDEQFAALRILLAAISVPSVSLWVAWVFDLWQYGTRGQQHEQR